MTTKKSYKKLMLQKNRLSFINNRNTFKFKHGETFKEILSDNKINSRVKILKMMT